MTAETEKAYRAWRLACQREEEKTFRQRQVTPGQMEKVDARIRRLKAKYEELLEKEKA